MCGCNNCWHSIELLHSKKKSSKSSLFLILYWYEGSVSDFSVVSFRSSSAPHSFIHIWLHTSIPEPIIDWNIWAFIHTANIGQNCNSVYHILSFHIISPHILQLAHITFTSLKHPKYLSLNPNLIVFIFNFLGIFFSETLYIISCPTPSPIALWIFVVRYLVTLISPLLSLFT